MKSKQRPHWTTRILEIEWAIGGHMSTVDPNIVPYFGRIPAPPQSAATVEVSDRPNSSEYIDGALCVKIQFYDCLEQTFGFEIPYTSGLGWDTLKGTIEREAEKVVHLHASFVRDRVPPIPLATCDCYQVLFSSSGYDPCCSKCHGTGKVEP